MSEIAVVGIEVAAMFCSVAEQIQPIYPHHAEALYGELVDTILTNERWNRIAALFASLSAIPGACLVGEEHDLRNLALSCVDVAKRMAHLAFGAKRPLELMEFVRWRTAELNATLAEGTQNV